MSLTAINTTGVSKPGRRITLKPSKATSPRASAKAKRKGAIAKSAAPTKPAPRSKHRNKESAPAGELKPAFRAGTKQALLIDMLRRPAGATVPELVKATRWQAHSVRGAMSGAIKKNLGMTIESMTVEGRGRIYRIAT